MSELTIYQHLRAGGLSPAGACAVMGNMFQESAMLPNNVENRCTLRDSEYTSAVDEGRISPDQFVHDKFGYGLESESGTMENGKRQTGIHSR